MEDDGQLLRTSLFTPDLGGGVFIDTLRIHRERESLSFMVDQGDNTVSVSYGILMTPEDPGCLKNWKWTSERIYGERIAKLAEQTEGENFSLCEPDYDVLAQRIVSDVEHKARFLQ